MQHCRLTAADVAFFRNIVKGRAHVPTESSVSLFQQHQQDWLGKYRGNSSCILYPHSTSEISQILKYCHDKHLPVVPQGGNTGLVGGSVPIHEEIVLSMAKMNTIHEFDKVSGIVVMDAGCILENVQNFVEEHRFIFPLDLGARGSCQIGGNLATNAGGLRYVKYGALRTNTMGIQVVLPNGRVIDQMETSFLRKDNTGFDLKSLFVGSEGLLGVITKAAIQCTPAPISTKTAVLGFGSFDHVIHCFKRAKIHLGHTMSACELFDQEAVQLVLNHTNIISSQNALFSQTFPFYILLEVHDTTPDSMRLLQFLEEESANPELLDAVLAEQQTQANTFWRVRESLAEVMAKQFPTQMKFDVSLPYDHYYALVQFARKLLPDTTVIGYGHLGDGNLHLNIGIHDNTTNLNTWESKIYDQVIAWKGSISAEHGIGQMKKHHLLRAKDPGMLRCMRELKHLWDPHNVLNPGKVF